MVRLEFYFPVVVGDLNGSVSYTDFEVTGPVLKLKQSFRSEHRNKLIYLKGNKGGS